MKWNVAFQSGEHGIYKGKHELHAVYLAKKELKPLIFIAKATAVCDSCERELRPYERRDEEDDTIYIRVGPLGRKTKKRTCRTLACALKAVEQIISETDEGLRRLVQPTTISSTTFNSTIIQNASTTVPTVPIILAGGVTIEEWGYPCTFPECEKKHLKFRSVTALKDHKKKVHAY